MTSRLLLAGILSVGLFTVSAQQIQNVKAVQAGDNVLVTYDISNTGSKGVFVRLLYSKDGGITFSNELKYVTGDVKDKVTDGNNKKILWDAKQELGAFAGDAVFKVEALVASGGEVAAPAQNKCLKVQLNDVKMNGPRLQVDFTVTPINGNTTIYLSAYSTNTFLLDSYNNKIKITDGFIAGTPKGQDKAALNGVPLTGYVTFDGINPSMTSIPKLTLYIGAIANNTGHCAMNDSNAAFAFTNVALNK